MEAKIFIVRCYAKSELALMYFPDLDKKSAVKKLMRWVNKCLPLVSELNEREYDPMMKSFNAREVKLIVRHIGEPFSLSE